MNEKELLQKIKEDAEHMVPPKSLSPEAIEKKLRDASGAKHGKARKPAARQRSRIYRNATRYAAIAAVFALAFVGFTKAGRISGTDEDATMEPATTEYSEMTAQESTADVSTADDVRTAAEPGTADNAAATDNLAYASDYEEVYEALAALYQNQMSRSAYDIGAYEIADEQIMALGIAEDSATATVANESGASASSDYSATNVQEQGVDEGDIVKTDGAYIYILRGDGSLAIVRAADEAEQVSLTQPAADGSLTGKELYLDGDTLNIIAIEYRTALQEAGSGEDAYYYTASSYQTVLYTYDVSDRSAPVLTGTVTQDGYYEDSRKTGDYIYLFSSWTPSVGSSYENSDIIPLLNGTKAEASDFYLPDTLTDSQCLVICSVSTGAPSEIRDSKVLVSGAQDFYVSQENIYIINQNYQNSNTITEITKFHYEEGLITGVAAGSIVGYLNDTFSMSEYEGNLRLVSTYYGDTLSAAATITDWTEHNALYILDGMLRQLSVIPDLAEGEIVRSARFLGDTGYFVTFRQTDPLFSVDLSDPQNPQILGELKISGFSSYLHFYGDGLLLGLGYEADEDTGVTTGLKLSMFDISDPSNVTEVGRYVIPGVTWLESLSNYKSILVNAEKNIIGFYCDNRYLAFSYSAADGFTQELIYDFYSDGLTGQADSYSTRGLYIGDTLYLAGESFVISFDMADGFAKKQLLIIE